MAGRSCLSLPRKLVFCALLCLLALAALEGVGWIVDRHGEAGRQVRAEFRRLARPQQPIAGDVRHGPPPPPNAPPHDVTLDVRVRVKGPDWLPRRYDRAGRVITMEPEHPTTGSLTPAQLRALGDKKLVVVLGGSSAFGFPYPYRQSLPVVLEQLLGPERYRVLNIARVGWPSGKLVDQLPPVMSFKPHVVIIWSGNNEWVHWSPLAFTGSDAPKLGLFLRATHSRALALVARR